MLRKQKSLALSQTVQRNFWPKAMQQFPSTYSVSEHSSSKDGRCWKLYGHKQGGAGAQVQCLIEVLFHWSVPTFLPVTDFPFFLIFSAPWALTAFAVKGQTFVSPSPEAQNCCVPSTSPPQKFLLLPLQAESSAQDFTILRTRNYFQVIQVWRGQSLQSGWVCHALPSCSAACLSTQSKPSPIPL